MPKRPSNKRAGYDTIAAAPTPKLELPWSSVYAVQRNLLTVVSDYLAYLGVRLFVCIVQALPLQRCGQVARVLATLLSDYVRIRHDVIDDNLRHAFPELNDRQRRDLTWRMWEHFFLMIVEVVHAPRKIHDTNWRDFIEVHQGEAMVRAFLDERPTVLICGHYGNFELSGFVLGILGFPSYTIARPLDNPHLDKFLNDFRGMTGQYILSKTGSSGQIESILERGGILGLLGDQYAGPKGCWVDFFGRPASSHKAIALFTLGSGAPTIFCYTRRLGRPMRHMLGMQGLLDPRQASPDQLNVKAITEWYTQCLERTIREAPEQYWWLHRRWKDTRIKKPASSAAAGKPQAA
jgi:KDO2-lipid IV(A) lauroyltransferase